MYLLLREAADRKPVVGGGQDEGWERSSDSAVQNELERVRRAPGEGQQGSHLKNCYNLSVMQLQSCCWQWKYERKMNERKFCGRMKL